MCNSGEKIHLAPHVMERTMTFLKNILTEVFNEEEPPPSDEVHRSPGNNYQHRVLGLCLRHLVCLPLHGRAVAIRHSMSCIGDTAG